MTTTRNKRNNPRHDHDSDDPNRPTAVIVPETVSTSTDDGSETSIDTETNANDNANTATFPLTRTFIHCDPTGRELAHVSVTATVTLTRVNGVTIPINEIERRFRRNFYLSFKGGKAGGVSGVGLENASTAATRQRRTLSPEHKAKLQEARQRRRDSGGDSEAKSQNNDPAILALATTLLDGLSPDEWFGKSDVLFACGIVALEPASWTLAIRYLLDTKQIEARGEKRGREYRRCAGVK